MGSTFGPGRTGKRSTCERSVYHGADLPFASIQSRSLFYLCGDQSASGRAVERGRRSAPLARSRTARRHDLITARPYDTALLGRDPTVITPDDPVTTCLP